MKPRVGLSVGAFLLVVAGALSSSASAAILSYDSGTMGSSLNWGMYAGVRFTNPYPGHYMNVEKLLVYGHTAISGTINLHLWESASGQPGSDLASLTGQTLGSSGWTYFDFQSFNIRVGVGDDADIFGGLYESLSSSWADAPYDTNNTTCYRSWYKSGSTWTQGQPGSGDRDLMVRLQYSQGDPVPEPATLGLVLAGCLALIRRRRK